MQDSLHLTGCTQKKIGAKSYTWGTNSDRKHIWLNDQHFVVTPKRQAGLRVTRQSSLQSRLLWTDAICIDRNNPREKLQPVRLMVTVFATAASVAVVLNDASESEVWALEIMRVTNQLLERYSDDAFNILANLLRCRQSTDSCVCIHSLLQRPWWEILWPIQEVAVCRDLTFLYKTHALSLARLQYFVYQSAHTFRLIGEASPDPRHDPAVLEKTVRWERLRWEMRWRGIILAGRIPEETPCGLTERNHFCIA